MIISLTTTPMMCAYLLQNEKEQQHGRLYLGANAFSTGSSTAIAAA